jgi:hypothetical protein
MSNNSFNSNPFESPETPVSDFYLDKSITWEQYRREGHFGYDENNEFKPCVNLPSGKWMESISYKHIFLLMQTIKSRPDFLEAFMEWVHQGEEHVFPEKRTSTTTPILRRNRK